ncbi:hypothetical protein K458DRAFT_410748 [Lentithecium fluviatile CBS 122367]|uniref:Uncharacterized protein n=1 Tax=Lentithecium fluviatile CBS 122367 TaxID=1168545 RepID=A0A6G1ICY7_9PLEO|nr:hypothetical protein K458DRAFT_410748 [Lentithecium fluviatile CBS 122367]
MVPVTGPSDLAITTFTESTNGHSPNDVVFTIPEDLAVRIEEIIDRNQQCPALDEVSSNNRLAKRADPCRALGGTGGVIINAGPQGPLNPLMVFFLGIGIHQFPIRIQRRMFNELWPQP